MAQKKDTEQITFRAPKEVIRQLDELCKIQGIKRGEFLISAITTEYDKMQGNPMLKEMMEQMRKIAETMKQMQGQANNTNAISNETAGEASDLGSEA